MTLANWGWVWAPTSKKHSKLWTYHIAIRTGGWFIGPLCKEVKYPVTAVVLPQNLNGTPKCLECAVKEPAVVLAEMAGVDLVKEMLKCSGN